MPPTRSHVATDGNVLGAERFLAARLKRDLRQNGLAIAWQLVTAWQAIEKALQLVDSHEEPHKYRKLQQAVVEQRHQIAALVIALERLS
jgi:hypothetical protein